MRFVAFIALVLGSGLCIFAFAGLARDVRSLLKWKRDIEGKTEFGDWLLVSKQEWDDFRKYFYAFDWQTQQRLHKLESGQIVYRPIVPSKWKPWAR